MSFRNFIINYCLLFIVYSFTSCNSKPTADLVIHHATIYTVDPAFSIAGAMAIKDGKIIAIGKNDEIQNKYESKESIDGTGKTIFPGFIDAHAHFVGYGSSLQNANLVGLDSWDLCVEKVKAFAINKRIPPGQWIKGRGWDQNDWKVKEFPTKELLDKEFPDNPVALTRIDGHAMIANQLALDAAKIKPGQTLVGGTIETRNGVLTGILIDNAKTLVTDVIPQLTAAQYAESLMEAQANCFAVGLTTVIDCGLDKSDVEKIDALQKEGRLKMRMGIMLSDDPSNYAAYLQKGPYKTERINVGAFKLYADGALGSRGACLLEPYSDKPGWRGFLLKDRKYFDSIIPKIYASGFQACTHAIGDSGNRMILQVYASVLKTTNDRRWRVEHAQVINEKDFSYFGDYSIVPSVQPTHATSDMYWAKDRLGANRIKSAYAYSDLMQQNGWIPLGTDFPVEDISPFKTFFAAVARQDANGFPEGGFQKENALSRTEAIRGMTIWAAKSFFEENEKGSLEAGKLADFIVLDTDLMNCNLKDVLKAKVLMTVLNGEKVYESKN